MQTGIEHHQIVRPEDRGFRRQPQPRDHTGPGGADRGLASQKQNKRLQLIGLTAPVVATMLELQRELTTPNGLAAGRAQDLQIATGPDRAG